MTEQGDGHVALTQAWFDAIEALREVMVLSETPEARVAAASALLQYSATFGTGIHDPFLPEEYPDEEDEDE